MKNVIILGGGISGLAAAYELSNKDFNVTILEKENYLGGLASGFDIDWDEKKYNVTKAYHHILLNDDATINLINEVGLKDKFHKKRVKQGFLFKNSIRGFSSPIEILQFPISFVDKFKLAKFVLKTARKKKWNDVEGLSAKDWIVKEAGQTNFEVFFNQLIKNKFKISAEKISAAWFGTRFAKEPSSFLKSFGWIEGGFSSIIKNLSEKLKEKNVKIITESKIKKISDSKDGKEVLYEVNGKNEKEKADVIISSIPPNFFLEIYNGLSEDLKKDFEKIEYLSCICVSIGFDTIFTKNYWTNILDKDLPFDVIFNHTSLYRDSAPEGKSVVYLLTYFKRPFYLWDKTEEEIFEIYMKALEGIFPDCNKHVNWHKVFKFQYAEAIYSMGFENPPLNENGIYFAGIYRIYPKIRNLASAIESGVEAAKKVISDSNI